MLRLDELWLVLRFDEGFLFAAGLRAAVLRAVPLLEREDDERLLAADLDRDAPRCVVFFATLLLGSRRHRSMRSCSVCRLNWPW